MNLGTINNAFDHRIDNGTEYQWKCFGPRARYLDYVSDHADVSIIFDNSTQEIYEATVCPKKANDNVGVYRWLNPEHKARYINEANRRNIDHTKAWDDVEWTDLEVESDWLEKATAIFNGMGYNTDVLVPVELEDSMWLKLAFMAHDRNITLNELVNDVIRQQLDTSELWHVNET